MSKDTKKTVTVYQEKGNMRVMDEDRQIREACRIDRLALAFASVE